MKPRHKVYMRLNLLSLFFIIVSFISVTLAWFAYSGLSKVATEVNVKAWYIELEKSGETVSNDIVISLSEIYPGMDIVNETVNIKNLGDSDAQLNYSIVSARILGDSKDNYVVDETTTSPHVEDLLSHEYPFHVNINLSKNYILSHGTESSFEVSVSWPLDSATDELDSLWGTEAYKFQKSEADKKIADSNYQIKPSIQIVISVTAEQYVESDTSSDPRYNLGDVILFDVVSNSVCTQISSTCLKTHVIDVNNKLGDETVTLLPSPIGTYLEGTYNDYASLFSATTTGWAATTRPLLVEDLLKIASTDVMDSFLVRENISDLIIGNLSYGTRMNDEITKATTSNGYYRFLNERFGDFSSVNCYWTNSEYNVDNGFAVKKIDEITSRIYNQSKISSCNVIPVILANKSNL